jgi:hypothetical protein
VSDPIAAAAPCCLWLNADADASFTETQEVPSRLRRVAAGLTTHAIVGARRGDSVLLAAEPDAAFLGTLGSRLGMEAPTLVTGPPLPAPLCPLAWNHQAAAIAAASGHQTAHPEPEVVRRVNHRAFLAAIEGEHEPSTAPSLHQDLDSLLARTHELLATMPRVVAKGAFGSASTGNLRLARHELEDPQGALRLGQLLERHGAVVLEPWLTRRLDLCATGEVACDGSVRFERLDRTVHTDSGSPLGTLFAPGDPLVEPHLEAMAEAVDLVGQALFTRGYFGPFCLDALVHEVDGELRLRRFVDLNARHPVSWPVRRWLAGRDRPGTYLWRLFVPPRLGARGVARLDQLLAEPTAWDPDRSRGLVALAPTRIRLDRTWHTAPKLSVLLAGDSIAEVLRMEWELRQQIDRRPPP